MKLIPENNLQWNRNKLKRLFKPLQVDEVILQISKSTDKLLEILNSLNEDIFNEQKNVILNRNNTRCIIIIKDEETE